MLPLAALFLPPLPERQVRHLEIDSGKPVGGARARIAAEYGAGDPLFAALLLLHSHGNPASASRGILRRHRAGRCDGRDDAVGSAGLRLYLTAVLGAFADRHGGLKTVRLDPPFKPYQLAPFLTQNEMGLFLVAAGYGFGFSGIIPAYIVSIRDLFPSSRRRGVYRLCCLQP